MRTAKAVNLVNTGKRENVYQFMTDEMNTHLSGDNKVTNDVIKKPLMTHFYSSVAGPRKALNDSQLESFYEALEGAFPGPQKFMDKVADLWTDKDTFIFTMPDGHTAYIRTKVVQTANIELAEGVEFEYDYATHLPSGNARHLVANIVHAYDGWVLREVVRRCDFEVATIHDSFWCLPSNMPIVRSVYREVLAELADSNALERTLSELAGYSVTFNKGTDNLSVSILKSEYALS